MSFRVETKSPMDDDWGNRDEAIYLAAGNLGYSHYSGAGIGCNEVGGRDHGWIVPTFEEAIALKKRLQEVPLVNVTIQEE
jgi:hypothetical protein